MAALAFGLALARGAAADAPPGGATNAVAELLTVARAAREDGLYAVAQKHLEAGLKLAAAGVCDAPQAEQAVVLMIQVLHEQRKHREILDFLYANRRWIRKETDDGLVPFWHAVARYEVGEADEALAEVSDFERRHPASAYASRVQRLRAWCFLKSNRLDAALKAFAAFDAATTDPAVAAENQLEWARALQAAGRLPQAREVLTRVVATATNPPAVCEAQYTLGGVLIEEGRSREALPLLAGVATNAAARDDLRAEAWFAQAAAQQAVSNTEEAVVAFTAGIAQARHPELKRRGSRRLGLLLLGAGRVDEGLALLKAFVAGAPDDPLAGDTQLLLASALLDHGRYAESVEEYQHYVESFTNVLGRAQAHRDRGWGLLRLGRNGEAATEFLKAYELFAAPAQKATALFKAADASFANAQYKLAADTYGRVAREFPDSALVPDAMLQAGESRFRADEPDQGEEVLQSLAQTHPDSPQAERALLRLAQTAAARGDWAEAAARFDRMLNAYSNSAYRAEATLGRAKAGYQMERYADALRDFEGLCAGFPTNAVAEEAYYWSGLCQYWMGNEEQAAAAIEAFGRRYPASEWAPRALFWQAKTDFNRGRHEDAEQRFLLFAERYHDDAKAPDALLWAARAAATRGEHLRANDLVNRLVKEHPTTPRLPEARFVQGEALSNLTKFSDAILIFQEIITRDPNGELAPRVWLRKGDCEFMLGADDGRRYEEAMRSYGAVVNLTGTPVELLLEAQYKIGRCLEKMRRVDEAIEQYYARVAVRFMEDRDKGVQHNEAGKMWFTRACLTLADLFEGRKEWRQAVSVLERMPEAGIPLTDETRGRIKKLRADHWWQFY